MTMKRRKIVVAGGFCLSFFLGTLMNLLFIPGFDHHQSHRGRVHRFYQEQQLLADGRQLQISNPVAAEAVDGYTEPTSSSLQQNDLQQQIRERYEEVLRYRERQASWSGTGNPVRPLERRRLMDLAQRNNYESHKGTEKSSNRYAYSQHLSPLASLYLRSQMGFDVIPGTRNGTQVLGCNSIDNVTNVQYLGSGYTKAVYKAALNDTLSVALKSVDFGGHDMENCVKKYGSTEDCYRLASFKIVKEMTLMERLQHPNILKVNVAMHARNTREIFLSIKAILHACNIVSCCR